MPKQPELPDFFRDLEIEQTLNELAKLGGLSDSDGFFNEVGSVTDSDNSAQTS